MLAGRQACWRGSAIVATLPPADEQAAGYGAISVHVESTRPCPYSNCTIRTRNDVLLSSTLE